MSGVVASMDSELTELVEGCFCDTAEGAIGLPHRGFINFKRIYGYPDRFAKLVRMVAEELPDVPLVAADPGVAPLVGALGLLMAVPTVYVRATPKERHLSYGADPDADLRDLFGERLAPGTEVCVVDDGIATGSRLVATIERLAEADLVIGSVVVVYDVKGDGVSLRRVTEAGAKDARALTVVHPPQLAERLERQRSAD